MYHKRSRYPPCVQQPVCSWAITIFLRSGRSLLCLRIIGHAERLVFVLSADGFLQHMVRTIVGTLVAMGRTQIPADAMAAILQSGQRQYAGPTAPAHGLFLVRVFYDMHPTVRA
jgi:tRNA pseudouridine38-40 synthase